MTKYEKTFKRTFYQLGSKAWATIIPSKMIKKKKKLKGGKKAVKIRSWKKRHAKRKHVQDRSMYR
jgi:hypothetical protein